jgi:paraquat-inducible protein B
VRGLTVGAPIDFRGITVGEVTHIDFARDQKSTDFAVAVDIDLYPQRFTRRGKGDKPGRTTPKITHQALDQMVAKGLRAQLQTGNLISGQRFIGLEFFANASAGQINWQAATPELPTQPGVLDSLQQQLEKTVKVLQDTLGSADKLMVRVDSEMVPELTRTMQDARQTLDKANQMLAEDSPLQSRVGDTLREVSLAARSVRHLADLLERQPEALLMGKKDQK